MDRLLSTKHSRGVFHMASDRFKIQVFGTTGSLFILYFRDLGMDGLRHLMAWALCLTVVALSTSGEMNIRCLIVELITAPHSSFPLQFDVQCYLKHWKT